jgi:Amiloride-sensitive sodium channel
MACLNSNAEIFSVVYSKLTIYFKKNHFMTSERTKLYGTAEFLANCGGLLGVFLGVSIMSLLEIAHFCTIRFYFNRKREAKNLISENNPKKTEEIRKMIRNFVAEYFEKTTIQGIKYLANTKLSRIERMWWAIVIVLWMFYCGSKISSIFWRYKVSPVIVNLAYEETSISQVRRNFVFLSCNL